MKGALLDWILGYRRGRSEMKLRFRRCRDKMVLNLTFFGAGEHWRLKRGFLRVVLTVLELIL